MDDVKYMRMAIVLAEMAAYRGMAPFGCVVVDPAGYVVGQGFGSHTRQDPTRHSEIDAIREASALDLGAYLEGHSLYSTHEPCIMCAGAITHAKLSRVVWGTGRSHFPDLFRQKNAKAWDILLDTSDPPEIRGGVLVGDCKQLFALHGLGSNR